MTLKLDNVGLIKNTEIEINGLTVLVGPNRSGKTTISKALYSILEACNDLLGCRKNDYLRMLNNKFMICRGIMSFELKEEKNEKYKSELVDFFDYNFSVFNDVKKEEVIFDNMISEFKSYINILIEQFNKLEYSDIIMEDNRYITTKSETNTSDEEKKEIFDKEKLNVVESMREIIKVIDGLSDIRDYTFKVLEEMTNREFSNQIVYKNSENLDAHIFFDDDASFFDLYFGKDGKLLSKSQFEFPQNYVRSVYYVDNPLIVDELESRFRINGSRSELSSIENKFHKNNLKNVLNSVDDLSIEEKMQNMKQFRELIENINKIIPGEIKIKEKRQKFYFEDDFMVNIENVASGMKIFLILKNLFLNNRIDQNTVIILDEPDARLHPEWQNLLGEIIIIMMKYLHCKFVLTTHNSNFLLALETYSLKYKNDFKEKFVNYYIAEDFSDSNLRVFKNSTNNLGKLYKNFSDYYGYLLQVREQLLDE